MIAQKQVRRFQKETRAHSIYSKYGKAYKPVATKTVYLQEEYT